MSRLTRRAENGTAVYATPSGEPVKWENNRRKVLQKLADYEDLEEQGLLLKLPFDVNSEVFIVSKQFILERNCTEYVVKKLKVREFRYNHLRNFVIICEEQMGDSIVQRHLYNANKIFLTKREAELELKRMEGAEQ